MRYTCKAGYYPTPIGFPEAAPSALLGHFHRGPVAHEAAS